MKIFNWVHRRFHQKDDQVGRDMKNDRFVKNDRRGDTDTLVLLEHVALTNAGLDIWKDGILTIGTLGLDPLNHDLNTLNQTKGYFMDKENNQEQEQEQEHKNSNIDDILGEDGRYDHEVDEEEEGEMDPLVLKAFKHGFNLQFHHQSAVDDGSTGDHHDDTCNDLNPNPNDQVGHGNILEIEEMRKKRGERITLADLFSADSDMKKKPDDHDGNDLASNGKKVARPVHAKRGISFPKKFIPRVKEDSRPIQKLHKLMTKMLKRKIHPDLESKTQIISKDTTELGVESLSLLQAQVATV